MPSVMSYSGCCSHHARQGVTAPALRQGDFVWCAFPEREAPLRSGPLHVAYALAVAALADGYAVMVAFTTSRKWARAHPQG